MSDTASPNFQFVGGHAALDFTNTLSRLAEKPNDRLRSYDDLLAWSLEAGLIDGRQRAALQKTAAKSPRAAASALGRAVELREVGYRLFEALIRRARPAASDVAALNSLLCRYTCDVVRWSGDGYNLETSTGSELDRPLALIGRAVAELLTGKRAKQVSQCHDETCRWLFLDRSPARKRRWCSMADCGNRAKARRHYARTHSTRP